MTHLFRNSGSTGHGRRRAWIIPILWLAAMSTALADSVAQEYDIKAAYLYNLTKFVRWPVSTGEPASEPFTVCVLGEDQFGERLQVLTKRRTDGRTIAIARPAVPTDARGCQLLFIARSESKPLAEILAAVRELPILTISDIPGFVDQGGMVGFITVANSVRLEVNLAAAQHAKLSLSAKLLEVAHRRVNKPSPEGAP